MRPGIARSRALRPAGGLPAGGARDQSTQASSCDENPQDVPDAAVDRDGCGLAGPEPARGRPGLRRRAREHDPRVGREDLRDPALSRRSSAPGPSRARGEASGTGVVIDGKRILTNAHVVLYASQLFVESQQSSEKLTATVEAVSPGMDLAVLKLDDESFFDKRPPLTRSRRSPRSRTPSWSTAIPRGARASRSPRGSSRGSSSPATTTGLSGLRIQVDAAINPGNSGGPALVDGKMIGLIFSKLTQADNIGYIIPGEEIDLFLKDVADGKYDGKPAMHDPLQTLENPALRGFLRLDKKTQGMIVHAPAEPKADYPLKAWDLITKIGDTTSTTSAWSRSRTTCACSSST